MPTMNEFLDKALKDIPKEKLDESNTILWDIIDQKDVGKVMKNMDGQSKKLMREITNVLAKKLELSPTDGAAFNRLKNLMLGKHKDEGMLRNLVFKIANELKIKLPSSSF